MREFWARMGPRSQQRLTITAIAGVVFVLVLVLAPPFVSLMLVTAALIVGGLVYLARVDRQLRERR